MDSKYYKLAQFSTVVSAKGVVLSKYLSDRIHLHADYIYAIN